MFLLGNKPLPLDIAFEYDGIKYPANWLRLSTLEDREALGIVEVIEQPRPDDRYYWVTDNGDGTYSTAPKDLDVLKLQKIKEVKSAAASFLSMTDWKVVRSVETNIPVDADTLNYRSNVRSCSNQNEELINACTSVEQLRLLNFTWPEVAPPISE